MRRASRFKVDRDRLNGRGEARRHVAVNAHARFCRLYRVGREGRIRAEIFKVDAEKAKQFFQNRLIATPSRYA